MKAWISHFTIKWLTLTYVRKYKFNNRPISTYWKSYFAPKLGGNKTKEMYDSLMSLKIISFVLFAQAPVSSLNFNVSKLA